MWKKWAAVVLCIAIVCALGACSMVEVDEERDKDQTVAVVDGVELKKENYYIALSSMLYNYGMSVEQLEESDYADEYRATALSNLVSDELLYQKAEELGIVDDSEEKRAEIKKTAQEQLYSMLEYYREQVAADESIAEEDKETEALKKWGKYREDVSMDDMEAYIDSQVRANAINELYDQLMAEVDYTEEQALEYYDQQVDAQRQFIEEDPEQYMPMYEAFGNTVYVNPAGYKYVKNLLIALPDEVQSEISTLRGDGDDEAANALRDEELAKIYDEANGLLERARGGEDFDALIEEYGDDPGMEAEPAKTYGYLVREGSEYVAEFEEASLALENEGDISDLVATDFGYHIIKYQTDGEGPKPFETVKDEIMETQLNNAKSSHYYEYIEELKEGSTIKEYKNRLTNHEI
ncbi:peptidylprolyl isomerase [Christensenellaceae bacterium OttesenSCG-928-K19]|nr:peptidylprolyl isomerase [Christensenellaceae bacterium OttesenSCG-928-K19]